MRVPEVVFPEYYLIRVNAFDKIAETHLEEWIKYLKDGVINDDTSAPGLQEAKRKLEYMAMSRSEKLAYDEHLNAVMIQNDVISTAMLEERINNAIAFKKAGVSTDIIASALGMTPEEVEALPVE